MRLLLGFETPTEGSVSYDGRELATLDVQEVRRQIGVVLQDARLRPGDIYSNIVGLSTNLTRDDAWHAAELAGLADDIEQMPMGIHTVVSEGGSGLSSGQRQRLIIARALAGRPKVLYLDEATSALDNRTQAHVSQSINAQLSGTTRVAIAHRLSTVIEADRIYVLSGGRIVQTGRYSQLIAEPGPFLPRIWPAGRCWPRRPSADARPASEARARPAGLEGGFSFPRSRVGTSAFDAPRRLRPRRSGENAETRSVQDR